ncbi:MAG: hypothetical protein JWQ62_1324 [Lacunisphaera sp.]|nr:hypothetical protein [Lacunisphaera sp.]
MTPAMADAIASSNPPGFPEALETCLLEDACVRADAGQLKLKLEETRAAATRAREGSALPGRLLAALGRRKGGPSTPEEAAEIFARENVLRRQSEESERLRQHYTAQLNSHLTAYLQTAVPVFAQQGGARARLAEWERIITDLRADLRELIRALGQARNNAVAGYDRSAQLMCATARKLLDQAGGLIRNVDAGVRRANDKATELGGLPGVTIISLEETVNNLTKLEIVAMLADFDRLVRELEMFEQRQLVDLQVPAVAAADALVAQAEAYLAHYREQLRAHYDPLITPEETAQAIPDIIERFRRG